MAADLYPLDEHRKPRRIPLPTAATAKTRPCLTVEILDDNGEALARHKLVGRFAWCFNELIKAGERGCTAIEQPAPRLSHYIFVLRRTGFQIDTHDEDHGGRYPGRHGRYILRSAVRVISSSFSEGSAA